MDHNQAENETANTLQSQDNHAEMQTIKSKGRNSEPEDTKTENAAQETGTLPRQPVKQSTNVEIEAYWIERKRYLQEIKQIPELRRKYVKSAIAYLIRRFLWSFTFFPVFIAFWIPLVLNRFNLVVTINKLIPSLQSFVDANPQSQAATVETLIIAWFSIGITFAIFDFILTPFKNPYAYEADVHMRAWEELHMRNKNAHISN